MKKTFQDLKHLNWKKIMVEMQNMFPDLFVQLLGMMLDDHDISSYTSIQKVIPRLGLVYGILMQGRNMELSIIHRTMSMLLFDHICDQKVFKLKDKKEEIWPSPMTKTPTPTEMSKGKWQLKQRHKKVRLNSDCGPT